MTWKLDPPTDRQLGYLKDLCEQRGIDPRQMIVGSFEDCHEAINAIVNRGSLEPWAYEDVPNNGFWAESVPF